MRVRRSSGGFTLIELLATVAIIAIIAGLTLGTLGYVQRKSAESRAKSEVSALAAAVDAYKLDFGSYPPSDAKSLYRELTGQGSVNKSKVFIEPRAGMVGDESQLSQGPFLDPWGAPYNYRVPGTENVGFFDLWSTAGGKADRKDWIHN
jgi:general secretion pathway protein G